MRTKLNNKNHLFQVLDFGIDPDSITVFIQGETNAVIRRREFEAHLLLHEKLNTTLEAYWSLQTEDHLQDLYEFLVLKRVSISKMFSGIYKSIQSIAAPKSSNPYHFYF